MNRESHGEDAKPPRSDTTYPPPQVRLNLDIGDYIRAAIMARKTTSRALSKPGSRHVKVQYVPNPDSFPHPFDPPLFRPRHPTRYYEYMIRYYAHFDNYHYLAKCWQELYETAQDEVSRPLCVTVRARTQHAQVTKTELPDHPIVKNPAKALESVLVYVALSSSKVTTDREQTDCACFSPWNKQLARKALLEKYLKEKLAEDCSSAAAMAEEFLHKELVHWPQFKETYASVAATHTAFTEKPARWEDLHNRVTEHNIKVIAKHYTKIRMTRLAQLIDLPEDKTEDALCKLVTDKDIWARVDRIKGIASFVKHKNPTQSVGDMKTGVDHVLAQITSACHLVHKEAVLHKLVK